MRKFLVLVLFYTPSFAMDHPGSEEFIKRAVSEHGSAVFVTDKRINQGMGES